MKASGDPPKSRAFPSEANGTEVAFRRSCDRATKINYVVNQVFLAFSRRQNAVVLIDRLAERLKRSCFPLLLQQSEGIAEHGGKATARQPQHEHFGDGGACAHYRRKSEENGQDIHPEVDSSLPQNPLQ